MNIVNKKDFQNYIKDIERAFLFEVFDNDIYLLSDMEYAGEIPMARVELMNFKLDISLPILDAIISCRGDYCGGISFIEYENISYNSTKYAIMDFLNLDNNVEHILCSNNELKTIAKNYKNKKLYVYVN